MKSYHQYCGLARTLDLIGDRWTMLILRELAVRDCRYTDLRDGLPGIATNLLAERLRVLGEHEIVERRDEPAPVATALYSLTERGRKLVPALHELVRWSTPLMLGGPDEHDSERGSWLAFAAASYLRSAPTDVSLVVAFECGGEVVGLHVASGRIEIGLVGDPGAETDLRVAGSVWAVMGLVSGALSMDRLLLLDDAARIDGSRAARRSLSALIRHNRIAAAA